MFKYTQNETFVRVELESKNASIEMHANGEVYTEGVPTMEMLQACLELYEITY